MKTIRIGLLGLGTVGAGTVNVLERNRDELRRRLGSDLVVTHAAARDLSKQRDCDLSGIDVTDDPRRVVTADDVDVVVELMGGTDDALDLVNLAIEQGKHVVTANKALIALHGNELFDAANRAGVIVAYESSVAGGIPIIKALREGLAANRIEWVAGIINGTGNFILTQMEANGRTFADALAEAQALGYAEADPTFDVEGIDAAHKLAILGSIAFGTPIRFDSVYVEGISQVTIEDIEYARELGYRIKHLGIARRGDNGIEMRVHPTLVSREQLLASVDGVMNAVLVRGDAVGPTLYHGAGAGALPTASAVVADVVDVVRALDAPAQSRLPALGFKADALDQAPVVDMADVETAYYLRLLAADRPGVLADIARILGDLSISIEAVVQKEPAKGTSVADLILLTHRVAEGRMNQALEAIEAMATVQGNVTRIRLEHLDSG